MDHGACEVRSSSAYHGPVRVVGRNEDHFGVPLSVGRLAIHLHRASVTPTTDS